MAATIGTVRSLRWKDSPFTDLARIMWPGLEGVAKTAGMKAGPHIQVAAEGLTVMDGTNRLLKTSERFLDCCFT
jgi:hypothetical protein